MAQDVVLKALGQEDGRGRYFEWEVYRTRTYIRFRQVGTQRTIGIPTVSGQGLTISTEVFQEPCPPEIVGKPQIQISNVVLGLIQDISILMDWMKPQAAK